MPSNRENGNWNNLNEDSVLEIRGNKIDANFKTNNNQADEELKQFLEQRHEEKRKMAEKEMQAKQQNRQQLLDYNPWGKPGGGAPYIEATKKSKFLETQKYDLEKNTDEGYFRFGKPGNGAPQRTKSGRLRTQISGDPDIRFRGDQNVQKCVENTFRYFGLGGTSKQKAQLQYRQQLDQLVQEKAATKKLDLDLQKHTEEQGKDSPFWMGGNSSASNGGSLSPGAASIPDPIFNKTGSPRAAVETQPAAAANDPASGYCYDPWGKGYGTPIRDRFGNAIRASPTPRPPSDGTPCTERNPWADDRLHLSRYCGGNGAPHVKDDSSGVLVTKLPRTLEKAPGNDFVVKENEDAGGMLTSSTDHNAFFTPRTTQTERKSFLARLGWTDDQSKKGKQLYLEQLKLAMEEKRTMDQERMKQSKEGGTELVELMREKKVGHPRRDSSGLLLDHKLSSTDITKRVGGADSLMGLGYTWPNNANGNGCPAAAEYKNTLTRQAEERHQWLKQLKEREALETQQHFEVWDSFWGRPGHGAPRNPENHRKQGISRPFRHHQHGGSQSKANGRK